jgi:hypothetical protein
MLMLSNASWAFCRREQVAQDALPHKIDQTNTGGQGFSFSDFCCGTLMATTFLEISVEG